jgi:type II secretory pathway pseudopilin PulG
MTNKKGFTYVELLVVLGLVPVVAGILSGVFKVQNYFKTQRDLQRFQDLNLLNSALNFYFKSATSVDPDGPNLSDRGIDEATPTVFISVPTENVSQDKQFGTCFYYPNNNVYSVYQANKNNYQNINGSGWIPINFTEVNYPALSNLPVDPVNSLESGLYYMYAFRRKPLQYEISAAFESVEFQKGGAADRVSKDGGDDENRLELGTNLNIIPGFLFSF